mgnify:CR=1 FL=1
MRSLSRACALLTAFAALVLSLAGNPQPAAATEVQEVASPGGIKAWLAENHASPLVSLRFAFRGGSATDPADRSGITRLMAGLLLAGSDGDDEQTFRRRMQRAGVRIGFQCGRDALYGSVDILSAHRDESLALLRAALQQPRFDTEALDRVRSRTLSELADAASDPRTVAIDRWYATALIDERYARPPDGNAAAIAAVSRDDLVKLHARALNRSDLVVAAAGDVTPAELGRILDLVFGGLREGNATVAERISLRTALSVQRLDIRAPSSVVVFGAPAPRPSDADYAAARVAAHVLGSGDLNSRLVKELRLRSGLVYSAEAALVHDTRAALLLGQLATGNDKVEATLAALEQALLELKRDGVSAHDVEAAKSALIGKTLLMLDSTASVADALLYARLDNEPVDFVARGRDALAAVTVREVGRLARKMLSPGQISLYVVGGSQE